MKFGLEVQVIENIISVLEQYPKVDKAFVFGSRAKGNYRPDSDVDIAIKGNEITTDDIIAISVAIETKGITHKFDLIEYYSIKEPALKEHIDRVGIELYSRWKEHTLDSISYKITDGAHLSPKDFVNGRIMFSVKDMIDNGFDYSKPKTISQEDFNSLERQGCKPEIDDILIAKDGSVLKHIFKVTNEPDYVLLSSIAIIKPIKEKVDSSFLVYTLKSPIITDTILTNFVSGSGVPRIVLKDFKKVVVSLPPLSEQIAIASILSSVDDKIDLLHSQNKTLEQLAETLFRQWFVEEVEKSWKVGKIDDIAVFSNGKSRPNEVENGEIPIYGGNGILGFTNQSNYEGLSIIIGRVGAYCGSLYIENKPIWLSDNALIARGKKEDYTFYLFYLLKSLELNSMAEGSSHPLLTQTLLKSIDISIPPSQKILNFNEQVSEFWNNIYVKQTQIRTLTQTRDTLLPKLMSGEVRVEM